MAMVLNYEVWNMSCPKSREVEACCCRECDVKSRDLAIYQAPEGLWPLTGLHLEK